MIVGLLGFIVAFCTDPKLFSRIELHLYFHPQDKAAPYCLPLFMMAGTSNVVNEFCATPIDSTQELFSSYDAEIDDILLTVQRPTKAVCLICNDLFAKVKNDFIAELSEFCSVSELRYVRFGVFSGKKEVKSEKH